MKIERRTSGIAGHWSHSIRLSRSSWVLSVNLTLPEQGLRAALSQEQLVRYKALTTISSDSRGAYVCSDPPRLVITSVVASRTSATYDACSVS